MHCIGIDPSSTCIGVAVVDGSRVVEMVPLRASRIKSTVGRIYALTNELELLLFVFGDRYPEALAAIEVTSGKVAARHRGSGAGLGVYGMGVGAALWAAQAVLGPERVVPVEENVWTKGVPKLNRQIAIRAQFPDYERQYGKRGDAGGDVSDAIGLAVWLAGMIAGRAYDGQDIMTLATAKGD